MSIEPQLRTTLLLGVLSTMAACQTADVSRRPNWDERVPPKVATREADKGVTPAPREAPESGGGGTPALALSNAKGRPGDVVSITVKLTTGGANIAGTQNDIVFDPKAITIAPTAKGRPDCAVNAQLGKEGTAFNFLPGGCSPGTTCNTVRALVLSLSNVGAIANGSVLYTCKVRISPQAARGTSKLGVERAGFSDPAGKAISGRGVEGTVTVE